MLKYGVYTNRQKVQFGQQAVDIMGGNSLLFMPKGEAKLMQAYYVKYRTKKGMQDARSITMKNESPATQGVCPTCGTKMLRIRKG